MNAPPGFDAARYPVIGQHYFGIVPPHVRDLQFRRDVERLHRLGPRAIYHLLDEIGCRRLCKTFIEDRAREYAGLDPDVLAAVGGDKLPPSPIHQATP